MQAVNIKKTTFYTAIAKFQQLGLFDFQDQGFSFRNLRGVAKRGNPVRFVEKVAENSENDTEKRNPVRFLGNFSENSENQTPKPLPLHYQDEDEIFINQDLASKGLNIVMETEKEFTDKVTDLLVQTLLYLQQKSDFLASPSRSLTKRGSSKKQKLTPYIIGQDYRVKSESNPDASNTAQPYRTHWRSGFYRWQPYGSREQPEYKLIWIEPVLVNG
ncbi:hypothetical protein NIES3806_41530 [Microcystis aeruginosa NIES-3806]|uniref:hypothetical protein n=1 Tax=Microcystis aeruginosa TaxID=1126 RepID=UPI00130C73AC|nr:hypothetical protein [Microcystis aeruginosa]GCL56784.1 hypothetical protein NIES3806_41530 [Microcystis aeruginosa NIES-3806]